MAAPWSGIGCAVPRADRRYGLSCGVAVLLALAGCSAGAPPPPAPSAVGGLTGVMTYTGLSHDHVTKDVAYPQIPPVGGPHWPPQAPGGPGWLRCAVYTEPVVDEFAVHSLEHGAVWLSYQPGASAENIRALTDLVAINPAYVLVSPVPGQPAPFMATAWGLQLSTTSAQDPRLRLFTQTYAGGGQGGEKGADCVHGSTLDQAKAALQAATG